tara:strand:+ start:9576 stop:9764 length:189 start_codon:yes stop_codon:yes gene_type:complete
MAKVKSLMMDLQDEFYYKADKIMKDCEDLSDAKTKIEALRAKEYNWMDSNLVENEVEDYYYA